ncbi:MAG: hypothetical protein ACOY16_06300 [Chloroflexota bacterium]
MSKLAGLLMMVFIILAGFFGFLQLARGQGFSDDGSRVLQEERQDENTRQILDLGSDGALQENSPNIGFIDSPSATCYQPDPKKNECFINWYYLYVDASPNYMITMTVTLNPNVIAHTQGFFQTSMYVPGSMYGQGFKVACGSLGSGGKPSLGMAYAYTIRARDSSNLSAANYGTVFCPAYIP